MKMLPKYSYVCEICGLSFDSEYDCDDHEERCRERKNRIRNCRYCRGTGYISERHEYEDIEESRGDYRTVRKSRWLEVCCPRCNY